MTPVNREEVWKEVERGEKSLRAAKVLFKEGLLEDALSRAYYAVLHGARAALVFNNISVGSHGAVRRFFGEHLVRTGKLDRRFGKILSEEQDERYRADYEVIFSPKKELVKGRIDDAEDFLTAIKDYLKGEGVDL